MADGGTAIVCFGLFFISSREVKLLFDINVKKVTPWLFFYQQVCEIRCEFKKKKRSSFKVYYLTVILMFIQLYKLWRIGYVLFNNAVIIYDN